jgi:hypothetical protein
MGLIGNHSTNGLATAFYLVPLCYIILAGIIGLCWNMNKPKIQ